MRGTLRAQQPVCGNGNIMFNSKCLINQFYNNNAVDKASAGDESVFMFSFCTKFTTKKSYLNSYFYPPHNQLFPSFVKY